MYGVVPLVIRCATLQLSMHASGSGWLAWEQFFCVRLKGADSVTDFEIDACNDLETAGTQI
jgi:hypothetical protein